MEEHMIRILANRKIRNLYTGVFLTLLGTGLLSLILFYLTFRQLWFPGIILLILAVVAVYVFLGIYFRKQDSQLEKAINSIHIFLDGNTDERIESDQEGELYALFEEVNTLASVLSSKAAQMAEEKVFLKETISDISHQLKTPLAALNIYNGLMQEEAEKGSPAEEFTSLSEKELDRIETLVQNLLKITRLDAGTLLLNKAEENIAEMMQNIELRFAYRAKMENKEIVLEGAEDATFLCDREWLSEAIENLVKNALDHTEEGDTVTLRWKKTGNMVKIQVIDTGSGIRQEDLPFLFKRFYRSRFTQDNHGLGLGLALAKAIVEGHNGVIEAESELGKGSCFSVQLLQ